MKTKRKKIRAMRPVFFLWEGILEASKADAALWYEDIDPNLEIGGLKGSKVMEACMICPP